MDLATNKARTRIDWLGANSLASWGIRPITSVTGNEDRLRSWRAGRIVSENGRLVSIRGRWWPHWGNLAQVMWDTNFGVQAHSRPMVDHCELYYQQAFGASNYLTINYCRSYRGTSVATIYGTLCVLDQIAKIKQSAAAVCQITNDRISDRVLLRWGWQPHCSQLSGRHFIKRYYGQFPTLSSAWRDRLGCS
ncbi:MAG: hypothetical protein KDB03_23080 [Planctomycetales bacterium]|nr:hypothetical protein [Planctomycetales bacterium]